MTQEHWLIKEGIAKEVCNWYPENENRFIFEPKGYENKKFSLTIEDLEIIREKGWEINTFYDGFVEIDKTERKQKLEKLERIEEILNE